MKNFTANNLSKLSHINHGFMTRHGGISKGYFSSLNLDEKKSDLSHNVKENFKRIKDFFGGEKIIYMRQQHSNIVNFVNKIPGGTLTGDALITMLPNVVLCVKTADCSPILIAHKEKNIVAAIHAGWKGALGQIIENTLIHLQKLDSLSNFTAALGPCMHQESFEVGNEIYNRVPNKDLFEKQNGKWHFDMPSYVLDKLKSSGIHDIEQIPQNTYANESDFFSFRRSTHRKEKNFGTQGSCIMIKKQ